ncbi:MAG: ZIP family metal transporter [Defluviitaleaceae bacterium]|nr:ZIP family metal transporter [Defluviitaleaceae bacterium]
MILLVLASGTWFAAAIGAAIVAFFKKENINMSRLIMGFAAGVILTVTFWELLYPSMHIAGYNETLPAWLIVPGSFYLGFMFIYLLDKYVHKAAAKKRESGSDNFKYRQSLVLASALSFHNVPEGFALGIILGALGNHFHMEELVAIIPMAVAVGLHKVPEGAALSISFNKEGMDKLKSFFLGQISGFIGFLMGFAGFMVAINMDGLMPFVMAFAGGAMIWVAVHELIPQGPTDCRADCPAGCQPPKDKRSFLTTIGVTLGVLAMIVLHTTFGHHHHGYHDHAHQHNHVHDHQHHEYDYHEYGYHSHDHEHYEHPEHHEHHEHSHDDYDHDHE